MSKLFSIDKSMFATFGKARNGTHSATIHMASFGEEYHSFGIDKGEGFTSREGAESWALRYMNDIEGEDFSAAPSVTSQEEDAA